MNQNNCFIAYLLVILFDIEIDNTGTRWTELDSRLRGGDEVDCHGDGAVMELNVTETGR